MYHSFRLRVPKCFVGGSIGASEIESLNVFQHWLMVFFFSCGKLVLETNGPPEHSWTLIMNEDGFNTIIFLQIYNMEENLPLAACIF